MINKMMANTVIDGDYKGFPNNAPATALDQFASLKWNLLAQDLPFPVAILKNSAMEHNSRWMRNFVEKSGAFLCPHGKTTMSPQLFQKQLEDGAWGITVATVDQMKICRNYGISPLLLANQLIGRQSIEYVLNEMQRDPEFEFYCLVDSVKGVETLASAARQKNLGSPIRVMMEIGFSGGRTGCRTLQSAMEVASAVHRAVPFLQLTGIECFEGLMSGEQEVRTKKVRDLLKFLVEVAEKCAENQLFDSDPIILSAGGSAYYDLVLAQLSQANLPLDVKVLIRSGCYLTHDSAFYQTYFEEILTRSETARKLGEGFRPALEVWALVQSMPEPGLALVTMGKRDVSFDAELPKPLKWFRADQTAVPEKLGEEYAITALNDQHGYMKVPQNCPLQIGDLICFGISHPCTTFDRWQLIYVVDDHYNVISGIKTFF
ncbi:MAG: amino acid deaminase [SAR324 cluster bacterium]|nr:amino acid deaminase [SAR324 cluster bacterium]